MSQPCLLSVSKVFIIYTRSGIKITIGELLGDGQGQAKAGGK